MVRLCSTQGRSCKDQEGEDQEGEKPCLPRAGIFVHPIYKVSKALFSNGCLATVYTDRSDQCCQILTYDLQPRTIAAQQDGHTNHSDTNLASDHHNNSVLSHTIESKMPQWHKQWGRGRIGD